jgi:hypothetical protein
LSLFLKAGRAEMDELEERWRGSLFQISEATDENDLDFVIAKYFMPEQILIRKKI